MPGEWFYSHFIYGSNYRLSEWQGAVSECATRAALESRRCTAIEKAACSTNSLPRFQASLLRNAINAARATAVRLYFPCEQERVRRHLDREVHRRLNAEGIPTQASYPPLHELDCFRNGDYRKCLSGVQATEKHAFLGQTFPHTQRAAWETVWIPQFALLGDETDMNEIAAAIKKIQRNAKEIAANASHATAEKVAR